MHLSRIQFVCFCLEDISLDAFKSYTVCVFLLGGH